ncbi:unnamed protein product [Caretta caretta]
MSYLCSMCGGLASSCTQSSSGQSHSTQDPMLKADAPAVTFATCIHRKDPERERQRETETEKKQNGHRDLPRIKRAQQLQSRFADPTFLHLGALRSHGTGTSSLLSVTSMDIQLFIAKKILAACKTPGKMKGTPA